MTLLIDKIGKKTPAREVTNYCQVQRIK